MCGYPTVFTANCVSRSVRCSLTPVLIHLEHPLGLFHSVLYFRVWPMAFETKTKSFNIRCLSQSIISSWRKLGPWYAHFSFQYSLSLSIKAVLNKIALKSPWTPTVTLSIEKVHVCLYSCTPSTWTGSLLYKFYSGSFPGSSCLFLKQTCGIFWTLEISPLTSRNQRATDRPLQSIFICPTKLYSLNPRPDYLLYRYGNFLLFT